MKIKYIPTKLTVDKVITAISFHESIFKYSYVKMVVKALLFLYTIFISPQTGISQIKERYLKKPHP